MTDETIRRRDVRVKLEWADIQDLVARKAMAVATLDGAPGVDGINVEVKLEQEVRGSPSFAVGEWTAVVKVTLPVE